MAQGAIDPDSRLSLHRMPIDPNKDGHGGRPYAAPTLVPEMAHTGKDHGHTMLIGSGNGFTVAH